jgi:hypothetical protein
MQTEWACTRTSHLQASWDGFEARVVVTELASDRYIQVTSASSVHTQGPECQTASLSLSYSWHDMHAPRQLVIRVRQGLEKHPDTENILRDSLRAQRARYGQTQLGK